MSAVGGLKPTLRLTLLFEAFNRRIIASNDKDPIRNLVDCNPKPPSVDIDSKHR